MRATYKTRPHRKTSFLGTNGFCLCTLVLTIFLVLHFVSSWVRQGFTTGFQKDQVPFRIALTGGPAAGKTSALHFVEAALRKENWEVTVSKEAATDLWLNGWSPQQLRDATYEREFYDELVTLELKRESEAIAGITNPARGVVLIDRGMPDALAYYPEEKYIKVLRQLDLSIEDAFSRYDAVIKLDSLAVDFPDAYQEHKDSNPTRAETVDEARTQDEKVHKAYSRLQRDKWFVISKKDSNGDLIPIDVLYEKVLDTVRDIID